MEQHSPTTNLVSLRIKTNIMKTTLIILGLLTASLCFSQTEIKKSSVSSGGGSQTVASTKIIYTVGEVVVQESKQETTQISEGFIGLDMAVSKALGLEKYGTLWGVKVYPNPVSDILSVELAKTNNCDLYLYDTTGKLILQKSVNSYPAQINVSGLKPGVYLLCIIDRKNHKYKNIKIQKL